MRVLSRESFGSLVCIFSVDESDFLLNL